MLTSPLLADSTRNDVHRGIAPRAWTGPVEAPATHHHDEVAGGLTLNLHNVGFSISKSGQVHEILHGVSATFRSGQVTALCGPSGAGKTTLLSVLSGHAGDWGRVAGLVTVNGQALSPHVFRRLGTLVRQPWRVSVRARVLEPLLGVI